MSRGRAQNRGGGLYEAERPCEQTDTPENRWQSVKIAVRCFQSLTELHIITMLNLFPIIASARKTNYFNLLKKRSQILFNRYLDIE